MAYCIESSQWAHGWMVAHPWYHHRMVTNSAQQKALALQWKAAAPALRKARHADIRRQDNVLAMDALNSIFREAIKRKSNRRAEGFVEMYRILSRQPNR
jgi:hypothetical protein